MSLLLTVTSNVLAIFTVPMVLSNILASSASVSFDPLPMISNLAKTVLLPLILGASLRVLSKVNTN